MKIKIQKLLGILLALPIIFGVFGNSVFAEATCSSESDCETKLQSAEVQVAIYETNIKLLEDDLKVAENREEAKFYYAQWEEEIAKLQKYNSGTVAPLKAKLQSFKSIEARKILTTGEQTQFENLSGFIGGVIDFLVKMVAVIAFALLVVGGFRLVAAAGNDNEIQKAKTMITYSIIGLIVVLLAYVIVLLVQTVLYR